MLLDALPVKLIGMNADLTPWAKVEALVFKCLTRMSKGMSS